MNAFGVIDEFERRVAEYAGSQYAVAVDCCTHALFLSMLMVFGSKKRPMVEIPAKTYVSVAVAILHCNARLAFSDEPWSGVYELKPLKIYDGAKRFRRGMYQGGLHCLSFHSKKILNIGRGGMVLTDDAGARDWLRRARYDGREGKPYAEERIETMGWHMYMTPEQAARGLQLLDVLPEGLPDQVEDYPDLRTMPLFARDSVKAKLQAA